MSTISASTTSTTAYKVTADTTGALVFQTGASPTTAMTLSSAQVVTFANPPTATGGGSVATNTAYGTGALAVNTTGSYNTAVGNNALVGNLGGTGNTAYGVAALYANTSGSENTALGGSSATYAALRFNQSGNYNVAVGGGALSYTTASSNTAVGYQAGYSQTNSTDNVFIGYKSGYSKTGGSYNTFVGDQSGLNSTSGEFNTFIGHYSGASTTGNGNTFVGLDCGYLITTGSKNTIIGQYNGNEGGLDIRTASNYIVLSDGDGYPRAYWNGANATFGGSLVLNAASTTSLYLGNTNVNGGSSSGVTGLYFGDNGSGCNFIERSKTSVNTTQLRLYTEHGYNVQSLWAYGYNTAGYQGNNSTAWSTTSDERVKTNIRPISNALEKICALNAVHFEYKNALGKTKTSFIAQQFEQVLPGHVHEVPAPEDLKQHVGEDGMMKALDPDLIPYLVEAIKELKAEIDTLKGQA